MVSHVSPYGDGVPCQARMVMVSVSPSLVSTVHHRPGDGPSRCHMVMVSPFS